MINDGGLKSLHLIWVALARNQRYSAYFDQRDVVTFLERAENEGLAYLTIALPSLGKALDAFHSTTEWVTPTGFKTRDDGLPVFMGDPIKLALGGDSLAVDYVRQLAYIFYRLEVPYDPATVDQVLTSFKETDEHLNRDINLSDFRTRRLISHMRRLIHRVLMNSDPMDIRPCHGSGATACRTKGQDKWHLLRYYSKLDAVYSYSDYFFYNYTHLVDEYEKLEKSSEKDPRARVVLVPKDSRGPRVISCEPAELLYIQQGLMRKLYDTLETNYLTRGYVNFTDQSINQQLAKRASVSGEWATMDLSEASDRVSNLLIGLCFPDRWNRSLQACRSEETELPDNSIVKLNKFAPMGSSCCFPIEALLFWACAQASIHMKKTEDRYGPPKQNDFGSLDPSGSLIGLEVEISPLRFPVPLYVYGDDIVVPAHFCEQVTESLERIGLLVNRTKTFSVGPFRESCGGEYHHGYDVTPVRLKKFLVKSHTAISPSADFANNLVAKFGYESCYEVISVIENLVGYVYPRSVLPLPGVILHEPRASNDVFFMRRFNKSLQRLEHRILSFCADKLMLREPNWSELLKKELTRESTGYSAWSRNPQGEDLLPGEYTVPRSVRAKWGWTWLG